MKKQTTIQRIENLEANFDRNTHIINMYISEQYVIKEELNQLSKPIGIVKLDEHKDSNQFFHPFIAALLIANLIFTAIILNKLLP